MSRAGWRALFLVAALGCEAEPRSLGWAIDFATPDLAARTALVEARVRRGTCAASDGEVVWSALVARGSTGPAPGPIAPGTYAFEASARDVECRRIAAACVERRLPRSGRIQLLLVEHGAEAVCAPAEECVAGRCAGEVVPDAGQDAGPGDAGSVDAGMQVDAGQLDAGRVCPMDATDGTGTACSDASDCAPGMVCLESGAGGDGGGGRCTRGCTAAADCLPGWDCDTPDRSDCDPSCPDTPICVCSFDGGFGGEATELVCDGADDDCDGRIDEAGIAGDTCGPNGTCTCASCSCGGGYTACGASCVDLQTSTAHCGACGTRCGAGFDCEGGRCVCNRTACGTRCVDLTTDEANCGTCGNACPTGYNCRSGDCICLGTVCGGTCIDTGSDVANCGACGNACVGVGTRCCLGVCRDTQSDASNCGFCGRTCPASYNCCSGLCRAIAC